METHGIRPPHERELFGHPVGLYFLFFTELWERFSYYGMRALLTLFLTAAVMSDNPGWGWEESEAINLYKWYTTLVYLASIPGGLIADRIFGQKKTVMIGGVLLCIGHLVLAFPPAWAFYTGLGFIIAGVGCLKPNISTMVGGLYPRGDSRRDVGFTIFYIGINIGAFLAGIIIGTVGENINWHYGFGMAGIGMLIGQIVYVWGQKYLKPVGNKPGSADSSEEEKEAQKRPLNAVEKDRMKVIFISFLMIIVFWGAFEQAGGLMNIYAKEKTNRLTDLLNIDIILLGLTGLMVVKALLAYRKDRKSGTGWFIGAGVIGALFLVLKVYVFTIDPYEVPATWFQSVNSFFIFTLGLPVALFWVWWKNRGKESSSLFKMAIGIIIMGLGFVFMSKASLEFEEVGKSAMIWLVLAYLFHTIGELCASPVALSFVTKLSPVKYAGFMMGAYFAATGLGNFVAGSIGEQIKNFSEFQLFTGITIFCVIFGLLVLLILKPLKRLTHGAEEEGSELLAH
ncbi:peptide MFS transporter [Maribacter sp. 2307ULW6-5]|uniref:peptide MFS transporter n=1 Tax=Maribacter sp. 2307ULW6-5 TaxID=3386275 RepID=UPI0039BCD1EE